MWRPKDAKEDCVFGHLEEIGDTFRTGVYLLLCSACSTRRAVHGDTMGVSGKGRLAGHTVAGRMPQKKRPEGAQLENKDKPLEGFEPPTC